MKTNNNFSSWLTTDILVTIKAIPHEAHVSGVSEDRGVKSFSCSFVYNHPYNRVVFELLALKR